MNEPKEANVNLNEVFAPDGDMYVNLEEFLLELPIDRNYPEYADSQFEQEKETENE